MKAPRGMHDILPDETERWQALEAIIRDFAARFGYGEIRTPIAEHTEVFQRTVEEKEMYTFSDRGGRSLTLRPEGTAAVMRAYLEHGMASQPQPVRLYYIAPMFRYDRPQKGRYRMHHQFGAEIIGSPSPAADVEVLSLPIRLIQALGLTEVSVRLNSVGDRTCRPAYEEALRAYFTKHIDRLCEDCRRRLQVNPLRILECKEPECHAVAVDAPKMAAYLCEPCREHLASVKSLFTAIGIRYEDDPMIVRGLDYYTRTAVEVHSGRLGGTQNSMLGGGRYDGLAEQLEGPPTPGVGFGQGLERLLLVLKSEGLEIPRPAKQPDGVAVFVASVGAAAELEAFKLVDQLRRAGISAVGEMQGRGLRAQMKQADKLGVRYAVILGEQELAARQAGVRDMRNGSQDGVELERILQIMTDRVKELQ
ncbi:MAG TPA: histidine--tRNA ligase [bacterium]|nr:histidine--tRNA ligase [bacterium]